jgi:hypothetical protein
MSRKDSDEYIRIQLEMLNIVELFLLNVGLVFLLMIKHSIQNSILNSKNFIKIKTIFVS